MPDPHTRYIGWPLVFASLLSVSLVAQRNPDVGVTYQDLMDGLRDPTRWLTYSGDYTGRRHSPLTQLTPQNVNRLTPQWSFQTGVPVGARGFEATPILLDGVLYVTGVDGYAWAVDARSGRQFWRHRRQLPDGIVTPWPINRGFGILGDRLFTVTIDAHFLALDRKTGTVIYDVPMEDYRQGYAATLAPLVVKDKVIVGVAGGEFPTRCFIEAYDAQTGKRVWRFYTVPAPGELGSNTWPSPDIMARGGGSVWMTGTYDPALNLVYFGTGNPNPDYNKDLRTGDNLYTDSVVALDADTGMLRWHYQFTPNDSHDWDSVHVPVLADLTIDQQNRKVVMVGNRNGFFYVLDRTTGKLLLAKPFTATKWAREIGADGRPIVLNESGTPEECLPDQRGSTNFMPPSFDPALRLFFVNALESCAVFYPLDEKVRLGQRYVAGAVQRVRDSYGALRAIDAVTGDRRWEFTYPAPSMAGVLSTAAGLVFTGDNEGNVMALDARTGKNLWRYQTGWSIWGAAPITYMLDGRQWILIPSGTSLTAFALPEH